MRLAPVLGHLHGAEGVSPPLPWVTVEDDEAASLIARGLAVAVGDDASAISPAPAAAPVENAAENAAEPSGEHDPERAEAIAEALDLLDDEHFVKTGPRAGKPKVDAVSGIVGFAVSAGEIDAAFAATA